MLVDPDEFRQSGPDQFDESAPPARAVPIPEMSGEEMLRIWYSGTGEISAEERELFCIVPPGYVSEGGSAGLDDVPPLDEPDHELPTSQGQTFELPAWPYSPFTMPEIVLRDVGVPSAFGVKAIEAAPRGMSMVCLNRVSTPGQRKNGSLLEQQRINAYGTALRGHELAGYASLVAPGSAEDLWAGVVEYAERIRQRLGCDVGFVATNYTRLLRSAVKNSPPTASEIEKGMGQFVGWNLFTLLDPDSSAVEVDQSERLRRVYPLDLPAAARAMARTGVAKQNIAEVLRVSRRSVYGWAGRSGERGEKGEF